MDTMHVATKHPSSHGSADLAPFVPPQFMHLGDPQTAIPRLAKDEDSVRAIEHAVQSVPTAHRLFWADAREISTLKPESVHLVLTPPLYWTLKEYRDTEAQLGHIDDYDQFLQELDKATTPPCGFSSASVLLGLHSLCSNENSRTQSFAGLVSL
jgi:hypothetical protein